MISLYVPPSSYSACNGAQMQFSPNSQRTSLKNRLKASLNGIPKIFSMALALIIIPQSAKKQLLRSVLIFFLQITKKASLVCSIFSG